MNSGCQGDLRQHFRSQRVSHDNAVGCGSSADDMDAGGRRLNYVFMHFIRISGGEYWQNIPSQRCKTGSVDQLALISW